MSNKTEETGGESSIAHPTQCMASELGCYCMRFCSDAPNNVHMLAPGKYPSPIRQILNNVFEQAVAAQKPYDLIIVDSEKCAEQIRQHAATLTPRPGILVFTGPDKNLSTSLRNRGFPAFSMTDILPDVANHCMYDEQVALALGEEGLKRLEAQPGEQNAYNQWHNGTMRPLEVVPQGISVNTGTGGPQAPPLG